MRPIRNRVLALAGLVGLVAACGGGGSNPGTEDAAWQDDLNTRFDMRMDDLGQDTAEPDETVPDVQKDKGEDTQPPEDLVDIVDIEDVTDLTDNQNPPDQDQTPEDETTEPGGLTVKDLQTSADSLNCTVPFGAVLVNVGITIDTAIVTAPPLLYQVAGNIEGFYVQDPGGGPSAGMIAVLGADQMPDLKPGAVVSLYGNHRESQCTTVFVITSLTVKDFNGPEPDPYLTTTADIVADPESYEGVLVKLENVVVEDPNPDQSNGLDYGQFLIADGLRVGNDYKVPYMTAPTDARTLGDTFNFVVGIVKEDHGNWVIMPRANTDMWLSGTTYPEEEPDVIEPPDVGPESDTVEETVTPDVADVVEDTYVPPDVPEVIEDVPDIEELDTTPDTTPDDVSDEVVIPPNPDTTVVITEVMYDPEGVADDKGEWVEVYNTTQDSINLNGWRLAGVDGNQIIVFGSVWIEPGQYFVFGANSVESTNGGVPVDLDYAEVDFTLDNVSDSVVLKNVFGQVVDTMAYDENAGWPVGQGASIQLIHPNLDNAAPTYWRTSTTPYGNGSNRGTPGAAYSN